ncbi:MAG: 4Fe-4S binding protein [Carbonactinosporaceae bacterium]
MAAPMTGAVTIGACRGCGACLLTCPTHAIRPRGGTLVVLDDRCTDCGECVEVCPVDAIAFDHHNTSSQERARE